MRRDKIILRRHPFYDGGTERPEWYVLIRLMKNKDGKEKRYLTDHLFIDTVADLVPHETLSRLQEGAEITVRMIAIADD